MSTVQELTYELDPEIAVTRPALIALAVVEDVPLGMVEYQLMEARREIRRLESRAVKAETRAERTETALEIAKRRIRGFEALTAVLANQVEKLREHIDTFSKDTQGKRE